MQQIIEVHAGLKECTGLRAELVPTEAELARREGRDYQPATALLERMRA